MTIRTIIVDDEPLARERLALLLANEPDVEIVSECGDGKSAVRAIRSKAPDLIFLDIELPEMDGFEIIESFPATRMPTVIFVTAYDQFALKAFKVHAADYLLKPVEGERLSAAMAYLRNQIDVPEKKNLRGQLVELMHELGLRHGLSSRIMLKSDGEMLCLKPAEIDWVEAAGNYVCFHAGKNNHIFRETMNQVEQRLLGHNFSRIHRSTIVNLERIKRLKLGLYGDYLVELRDGTKLTMSRFYRRNVLKQIAKF